VRRGDGEGVWIVVTYPLLGGALALGEDRSGDGEIRTALTDDQISGLTRLVDSASALTPGGAERRVYVRGYTYRCKRLANPDVALPLVLPLTMPGQVELPIRGVRRQLAATPTTTPTRSTRLGFVQW
jgi:hypothetical protein